MTLIIPLNHCDHFCSIRKLTRINMSYYGFMDILHFQSIFLIYKRVTLRERSRSTDPRRSTTETAECLFERASNI